MDTCSFRYLYLVLKSKVSSTSVFTRSSEGTYTVMMCGEISEVERTVSRAQIGHRTKMNDQPSARSQLNEIRLPDGFDPP